MAEWLKKRRQATSKPGAKAPSEATRRVRLDGTTFYAENTSTGIEYQGRSAYMILSRDVTERVRADKALKESELKFRDFAESAADRFWETDENHRFTFISEDPQWDLIKGPEGLIGKTRWEANGGSSSDEQWREHKAILDAHRPFRQQGLGDGGNPPRHHRLLPPPRSLATLR